MLNQLNSTNEKTIIHCNINGKAVDSINIKDGIIKIAKYQEVEYLENTGEQWIDTEYTITNAGAKLEYGCVWTVGTDQLIAGSISDYGIYPIKRNTVTNGLQYGMYFNSTNPKFEQVGVYYDIVHETNNQGAYYTANGIENQRYVDYQPIGGCRIKIFYSDYSNTIKVGRIYYLRITDNDTNILVRDMKSVYRIADGKPGMLDLVSKQFFTNQGTGEFLTGAPTGKYY